MPRTVTLEFKLTSPATFDKALPIEATNPILEDLEVQAFEAIGVKNHDGTFTKTTPFEFDFPVTVVKALHIVEHLTIAGDFIETLSAEEA